MTLEIVQIPVMQDNFVYLLHDEASGYTAVVDPAVAAPVTEMLEKRDWQLTHILNTHHHFDHVGANEELKDVYGCHIIGPAAERERIPGIDTAVADGDTVLLGESLARVYDVPGHTRGHIAYWFDEADALFCGDALFSMGCGRLFEGTPEQMWASLQKLMELPDETKVYCAHEYTLSNGEFAMSVEPQNKALSTRVNEVKSLRSQGLNTVPSTMAMEKATNPFLRPDSPELQASIGLSGADPITVFTETRARKDSF